MTTGSNKTLIMLCLCAGLMSGFLWIILPARAARLEPTTATHLFVSPNGSGNTCSQEQPCSLQTATNSAMSGFTIYLSGGTYTGTGNAVISPNYVLTYTGGWDGSTSIPPVIHAARHPSILDGEATRRGVQIITAVTVTFNDIKIVRGYHNEKGAGIYVENGSLIFVGGGISNCVANHYGGGVYIINAHTWITGTEFINNHVTYGGGGAYVGHSEAVLVGNTFQNNTSNYGSAIDNDNSRLSAIANLLENNQASSTLLSTGSNSDLTAVNNILARNTGSGFNIYSNGQADLLHNTLVSNTRGIDCGFNGIFTATNNLLTGHTNASISCLAASGSHNLFWNNGSNPNLLSNPVQADPQLRNPSNGDFRLTQGSAAINQAIAAGIQVDFEGQPRPSGAGYDIGADEYWLVVHLPVVMR